MSISDSITYLDITERKDLVEHFEEIAKLFLECFGKPLERELWEWAYLNNPSGQPLVSLAIAEGKVVGHYAVIPMPLENSKHRLQGYLSMTTMVSAAFRRYRLFQRLAERVYEHIDSYNLPAVVFGFPNDKSVAGFNKRLAWTISEEYRVIELTESARNRYLHLLDNGEFEGAFTLSLDDKELKDWRVSKPYQEWEVIDGVGLKAFDSGSDLMYLREPSLLESIDLKNKVNFIMPSLESCDMKVSFDYRFGYRLFNCEPLDIEPIKFFVQMSMSDVF